MRARLSLPCAVVVLVCTSLLVFASPPMHVGASGSADPLKRAEEALERHNYKTALDVVDGYLEAFSDGPQVKRARVIRALANIRLERFEEGVAQARELLIEYADLANDVSLHETLAWVGEQRGPFRYLAIDHYEVLAALRLRTGDRDGAAQAQLARGRAFVHFSDWKKAKTVDVEPPEDYRARRGLQRKHAVRCFDRALKLALDLPLVAEILTAKARVFARDLHLDEEDIGEAIGIYRQVVERLPQSSQAAAALLSIGELYETRKRDYVAAIEAFRGVLETRGAGEGVSKRARKRIARIESPYVQFRVGGPVAPGTALEFGWESRNVRNVELAVYRVELLEFARQYEIRERLDDKWKPAGDRPLHRWTLNVPDERKYLVYRSGEDDLKPTAVPVSEPGAYIVVAEAEGLYGGDVRTVSLGIISNITGLSYTGRERSLLWTVHSDTGAPAAGAEVHLYTGSGKTRRLMREAKTDDAGLLSSVRSLPTKPNEPSSLMYIVRKGEHYAVCDTGWQWRGRSKPYRLYSFTDRPVYHPGQTVHYKHILRRDEEGRYENQPDKPLKISVRDARGQIVHEVRQSTNAFGTVAGEWSIPAKPPLGEYRMEVEADGSTVYAHENTGAAFRVEEYRKPEFKVTVAPGESSYRIGDTIAVAVTARYYFGDPVPEAEVKYTVHRTPKYTSYHPPIPYPWLYDGIAPLRAITDDSPEGRRWWMPHWAPPELVTTGTATTDENGVASIAIKAEGFDHEPAADVRYIVEAEATDSSRRVITGTGAVVAAHRPFEVNLSPQRNIYQPGDTVHVDITARDANDKPVAFQGKAEVFKLERLLKEDSYEYKLGPRVAEGRVEIDGTGFFRWVADEAGPFRVVVTADAESEPDDLKPTGQCEVWIAKPDQRYDHFAYRDVEMIFDKSDYRLGDVAQVLVTTRQQNAYVLLTTEANELLDHRIVFVPNGSKMIEIPLTERHVPNFHLSATVVSEGVVHQDRKQVVVPPTEQLLSVAIKTAGEEFEAGTETSATITVTDHQAKPAGAEVAVMVVDSSVYYIQPEYRQAIEQYFFGRLRPLMVHFATSYPDSTPVFSGRRGGREMSAGNGLDMAQAMPSAAKARQLRGEIAEEMEFAAPKVRKAFADAIVWIAQGRTDRSGALEVDIPFSDDLTTWAMHAVAIDADTRVGQASADLITTKDIIARLQTPRFLVEGDRAVLSVIAHNDRDEDVRVRVSLAFSTEIEVGQALIGGVPGEPAGEADVEIIVPAKGEVVVDFPTTARTTGDCTLTAAVAAEDGGDAVRRTVPVIPYGANKLLADGGLIRDGDTATTQKVTMTLPAEIDLDSPLLEVHLSPSIASVMLDSLPYLLEYPYGCTEQTMSRFLPAVVTRKTLIDLGVNLQQVKARMEAQGEPAPSAFDRLQRTPIFSEQAMTEMIGAGLGRLATMQQGDGGWGWWTSDSSNPYMTAYVVYGLSVAADADVSFDHDMLRRGIGFLRGRVVDSEPVGRYSWADKDDDSIRAWMLYALAMADAQALGDDQVRAQLDRVFERRDELTDYARAMLALTLHHAGRHDQAKIVVENFDNTVLVDEQTGTVRWGSSSGYFRWYNNGLEATAMVLRALLAIAPDHPHIPKAVNWIVRNRRGVRWRSTKDTAFAVYALADYLAASGELAPDMTVTIEIDGTAAGSFAINKENALTFDPRIAIGPKDLSPGVHTISVEKKGTGSIYFSTYLDFYTKEDPITEAGNELYIQRSYSRLTPKEVEKTRTVFDDKQREWVEHTYRVIEYEQHPIKTGDALSPGDMIEVRLDIDARNNFEYLIFTDPKPAGCEPVRLRSGASYGDGVYSNIELRDQQVVFFATYLSQGQRSLTYRLRCETPGTFAALPAIGEAMYAPFVRGNSASERLTITE